MSFPTHDVVIVPNKVLHSVFSGKNTSDNIFSNKKGSKQRMVTILGNSDTHMHKLIQEKIDGAQKEKEQWLLANATETHRREIYAELELEKLRVGSLLTADIVRLMNELALVDEKLRKESQLK